MRDGHAANQRGDYAAARSFFLAAGRMSGKAVAQISAANMALKSGRVREALMEYEAQQRCCKDAAEMQKRSPAGDLMPFRRSERLHLRVYMLCGAEKQTC